MFSFQGVIASGETPVLSDFKLTSIVIDTEHTQPEPPTETEEAPSHETTEPSTGDEPDPATEETNETEEPIDPDPAERDENTILCFGEYLSEENSIKVYWYSTAEGAVSIHENTDGNGWKKLAEVTDGDLYEFTITEDFVIKYIKVSQQTADGMIESEPFIVAASEDGYACTWLDSDNDGLPDYAEKIYGTDPENADTDGDGLSDYDEIYKTGTNSLKYDTDEDGVNDADSDNDKDGLTNSEELALGTNPNSADTDGDGLSDYDEINKHNTDPLKADSDGDTLNDGDEITLGLDPNDPETFGVPDAEYKVKQTISADSEVMERVNTEDSPYELSLEITASGNAQNLIAGSSIYSAITESDARLGGAVSLSYYGGDVEKVKLTYEIGENYISNEGSEYAKNCVDLQGIKRYNIFRYFEELNMLLPVATEFDEENNALFAETDELGTYCVLDMEVLLQTFGANTDGSQTEQVERQMYAGVNDGYNICFIIDIRKGVITDDQLDSIKKEILAFMANAMENDKRIGITICVQANSDLGEDSQSCEYVGYYTSSEGLKEALDNIKLVNYVEKDKGTVDFKCLVVSDGIKMMSAQSRGTNNYVFDIYSIPYSYFNRSGFAENEQELIEKNATLTGVNISFISSERKLGSYQTEIPKATGGLMIEGFTDFGKIAYNHVFEEPLVEVEKFNAILATGYQQVELDEKLNAYNGSDTDKDTLTDWVEVGGDQWIEMGLFSYDKYNNVVLPTVGQCIDALGDVPFYVEGALADSDFKGSFLNMRVMPITSDPTQEDSDGDSLCDICDNSKLSYYILPEQILNFINEHKIDCCKLRVSDDGFIFVEDSITEMFTNLDIVYADWHLFCVSTDDITHFGLCKLRCSNDSRGPSFALPFYNFDLDNFITLYESEKFEDIDKKLDWYTSQKLVKKSDLLLNYFSNASNQGFYILADAYIQEIVKEESITDRINIYELNVYQKNVFDSLSSEEEKESMCFFISDPQNLTNLEKDKILLLRSGNPNIYSFAAEINYHAQMAIFSYGVSDNIYFDTDIAYQNFIMLFSINTADGKLTEEEQSSLNSLWEQIIEKTERKFIFNRAMKELSKHALKSDAGVGTSGTLTFEEFFSDWKSNINLDIIIQHVFYEDSSALVQQARRYHNEKNAYH